MTEPAKRERGDRPFPWRCPICCKGEVTPQEISYTAEVNHDGDLHKLVLPRLTIPKCSACGQLLFTDRVDEQINEALRTHLRLLRPEQIEVGRKALSLTQGELAEKLGVAEAVVARWETGALIQSRTVDNLLRVYFALPAVRAVLTGPTQDPALGTEVTGQGQR
jgi:putative zinc finger/helix-turn-helix YgiT family protein